jgi:hypothetical protein
LGKVCKKLVLFVYYSILSLLWENPNTKYFSLKVILISPSIRKMFSSSSNFVHFVPKQSSSKNWFMLKIKCSVNIGIVADHDPILVMWMRHFQFASKSESMSELEEMLLIQISES